MFALVCKNCTLFKKFAPRSWMTSSTASQSLRIGKLGMPVARAVGAKHAKYGGKNDTKLFTFSTMWIKFQKRLHVYQ